MQGYILNIQGWDSETMQVLRMVLVTIPLLVLNYFYTEMVYTGRIIFDGSGKPRFFQARTKDGQKICQTRDIPEYSGDGFWCLAVLDIEIS